MRQATIKQGKEFSNAAKTWLENHPKGWVFSDVKSITIRAVAEYIANQSNKTIYKKD